MLQIPYSLDYHVGDIIKVDGKSYQITKKTTTAIAVVRWYWWDTLRVKLLDKVEELLFKLHGKVN